MIIVVTSRQTKINYGIHSLEYDAFQEQQTTHDSPHYNNDRTLVCVSESRKLRETIKELYQNIVFPKEHILPPRKQNGLTLPLKIRRNLGMDHEDRNTGSLVLVRTGKFTSNLPTNQSQECGIEAIITT